LPGEFLAEKRKLGAEMLGNHLREGPGNPGQDRLEMRETEPSGSTVMLLKFFMGQGRDHYPDQKILEQL
jgi:hypothetical protein